MLTTAYAGLPSNGAKWLLGFVVNLRAGRIWGEIPWFLACLFLMEIGAYVLVRVLESRECEVPVLTSLIGYEYSVLVYKALPVVRRYRHVSVLFLHSGHDYEASWTEQCR